MFDYDTRIEESRMQREAESSFDEAMRELDEMDAQFKDLASISSEIQKMRQRMLCSNCCDNLSPFAQEHLLAALAELEKAKTSVRLAALYETRETAALQMR